MATSSHAQCAQGLQRATLGARAGAQAEVHAGAGATVEVGVGARARARPSIGDCF